jgi:SPOR domain
MSMADDSNVRSARSAMNHPNGESSKAGERSAGDPLAELARLIGQDDLFDQRRKDTTHAGQRLSARAPTTEDLGPAPDWLGRTRATEADESRARSYPHGDPLEHARRYPHRAEPEADDAQYAAAPEEYRDDPRHAEQAGAYAPNYDQQGGYEQAYAATDAAGYEPDPYADGRYDDTYEEPVGKRRRGGLITVAAVLGLAIVGTAGAFAYRAFTGSSSGTLPPVIQADSIPAKVAPSPSGTAAQASKLIYDRAEKPGAERVVSREEQPIDMKDAKSAGPKMVTTSAIAAGGAPGTPTQAAMAYGPSPAAASAGSEPKKVKTIAIRPDGTTGSDTSASRSSAAPGPTRGAAPPTDAARAPTPTPTPAPTRTASIPAPGAAGPMVTASTPPAGAYVVQLVSNKSEAEAQAAFKTLQTKYPGVLGSRTALIRRVELGDKGTYYRAQVGPFANSDQANSLCDNLKAAGGQCIVQRN